MELSFSGAKVPLNFRSRERKFHGTFAPGSESSTYGTFVPGSECSWERKFLLPMGWPDYIFGEYRETARCRDAQHGYGVCCAFAPQLVCIFSVVMHQAMLIVRSKSLTTVLLLHIHIRLLNRVNILQPVLVQQFMPMFMYRDHSFPRHAEFWAEPRNLPVSAELLHFPGISRNSVLAGDKLLTLTVRLACLVTDWLRC